jgi:hypothetical protein
VAEVVFIFVAVEDEVRAEFVDGVVGQMHAHVLLVRGVRFLVLAGG